MRKVNSNLRNENLLYINAKLYTSLWYKETILSMSLLFKWQP